MARPTNPKQPKPTELLMPFSLTTKRRQHNFLCSLLSDTGAVFAFGRSHLTISGDGNDNNYFFIKKDRVKKLICGRNQSAVICGNVKKEIHQLASVGSCDVGKFHLTSHQTRLQRSWRRPASISSLIELETHFYTLYNEPRNVSRTMMCRFARPSKTRPFSCNAPHR